jgi:tRNA(Leu) C34 or U34 (ribose-2'-O)-methylase TrmL
MGLGAVHAVVPGSKLKQSKRTTAGAEKWLDVRLWDSTRDCLSAFRSAGYQIVTTHLSAASVNIQDVDWTKKTAFVLGNERDGVSDTAIEMADAVAVVPMAGFVESFNVSVAAALIMWEAQQQRLRRLGRHGDLSDHEADILLSEFLVRGVVRFLAFFSLFLSPFPLLCPLSPLPCFSFSTLTRTLDPALTCTLTHTRSLSPLPTHTQREPALLIDELIGRGVLVYDRQTPLTAGGSGSSSSGRSSSSDGSSSSSSDGLAAAAASAAASAALKPRSSWADWVGALEGGGGGGDSSSDEA